jgi:hypothetical protein
MTADDCVYAIPTTLICRNVIEDVVRSHEWAYKSARAGGKYSLYRSNDYNCNCHPYAAMKLYLAVVLVSLSVLTAAKRPFVRRHKENPQSHHQEGRPAISTPCSYSHSGPVTYPGASTNVGTPTSSVTPSVAPTTYSTGWVQNPKGNASFTAYSGCQYACRSYAHFSWLFPPVPTLSMTFLLQRAVKE